MNSLTCHDPDTRVSLGFYVLGKLDGDERAAVERHLSECAYCRAERDDVNPVVPVLGLLSADDISELTAEFGAPDPVAVAAPVPAAEQSVAAAPPTEPPVAVRPKVGPSGVSGPPDNRPGRSGRRGRRFRLTLGAVAAVVVFGTAAGMAVWLPDSEQPVSTGVVASTDDSTTGVRLSVVASGEETGLTVRATVVGLRAGVHYELYAVTGKGETLLVAALTGTGGVQEVTGKLVTPASALAFFSLRQTDGAVVVMVQVTPDASPSAVR